MPRFAHVQIALSALVIAGPLAFGSTAASAQDIRGIAEWARQQQIKRALGAALSPRPRPFDGASFGSAIRDAMTKKAAAGAFRRR